MNPLSIQDQASYLIMKYSNRGSFQNTGSSLRNSGNPGKIQKALGGKGKKLTMKQMRSVEKLTQGLSSQLKSGGSRGNLDIPYPDNMSDQQQSSKDTTQAITLEMQQPDTSQIPTSKNSEMSNSFQKKAE